MTLSRDAVIDANSLSPRHAQRGRRYRPDAAPAATRLYAGLFEEDSGGYVLWNTPSWSDFTAREAEYTAEGNRLVSFDSLEYGGDTWFLGAWQQISGGGGCVGRRVGRTS